MNATDLWQASAQLGSQSLLPLTWALAHFLWQGCAIAVAYATVAYALPRASANVRYLGGVTALLAMAVCLPATLWLLRPRINAPAAAEVGATSGEILPFAATSDHNSTSNPALRRAVPRAAGALRTTPSISVASGVPSEASAEEYIGAAMLKAAPYVTAVYLAGVILMLLRLLLGLWSGRRLRNSCEPMTAGPVVEMLRRNARRMRLRAVPAITCCRRICVPLVVGVLRPTILLPASLASGLTSSQLEVVLLHELAHVRRFDLIVNILQRLIEAVLFFHPAVWWVSRRVSLEREHACDDVVLHLDHDPVQYADTLLRIAELSPLRTIDRAALAATGGNPSQLRHRVLRLLGIVEKTPLRLTSFGVLTSLLLMAAVLLAPMICRISADAEANPPATDPVHKKAETAAANNTPPATSEPLTTGVYRLQFARAGDVRSMVMPLLSTQGKLTASSDTKGENIVVVDYDPVVRKIERVIAAIDVEPPQVLIDAVIVEVALKKNTDFVNLAVLDDGRKTSGRTGHATAINSAAGLAPGKMITPAGKVATRFGGSNDGLRFGFVGHNRDETIRALEKIGHTKILATTRLLVLNKQRAELFLSDLSRRQPPSAGRTDSTNFVNALSEQLVLRPFISSDNRVRMDINLQLEKTRCDFDASRSRQVQSNVIVPDGTTFVLGGCEPDTPTASNNKGPTSPTANNVAKKELLLLLTPYIYWPGKTGAAKTEHPLAVESPLVSSSPSAKDSLTTIHCDDMDVRKVLEMLTRQAQANIVVAPGVAGKITMDIRDKSLDEMLAIIASLCNLTMRREGDVIFISTPAEIRKAQENNLPVRVYHLNYVNSSAVEKMIRPLISPKGHVTAASDAETGLPDKNANGTIIIVQDYEDVLKTVDGVIAKIDVPRH